LAGDFQVVRGDAEHVVGPDDEKERRRERKHGPTLGPPPTCLNDVRVTGWLHVGDVAGPLQIGCGQPPAFREMLEHGADGGAF